MNFKILFSILFAILSISINLPTFASEGSKGQFKNTKTCFRKPFSSYDEWISVIKNGSTKRFKEEAKIEQSISNFKKRFPRDLYDSYRGSISCDTFLYESDGTLVRGFVIKPKHYKGLLPVIIYNRGGNGRFGSVNFSSMVSTLFPLVNEGFIVVGSQYRGSSRRSDPLFDDEFGGRDVNDVVSIAKLIPSVSQADPNRVGMLGTSRGAMQSYLAIKAGVQVKALATIAGNTDLKAGLGFRPEMENVYKLRIPNYLQDGSSELLSRSAIHWIDKLNVTFPILLIHGVEDKKVGAFHSINMAKKLSELEISHELILYPEDDHGLKLNRQLALKKVANWFNEYL